MESEPYNSLVLLLEYPIIQISKIHRGFNMPFANIRTTRGMLNSDQKQRLKDKITEALVEIEGGGDPNFKNLVWVLIDESEPENWQLGALHPTAEFISEYVHKRDQKMGPTV